MALLKIADLLEANTEKLLDVECKNTGKPRSLTASEELPVMIDQIRFFAGAARNLEGKSAGQYMKGMFSMIVREPIGVCAQVTPWNYPVSTSLSLSSLSTHTLTTTTTCCCSNSITSWLCRWDQRYSLYGNTLFFDDIFICTKQLMMAVWKWAPAIAAGNTVVLKPSETTPMSTLFMAELMGQVLPPGVFNVVCGAGATGTALVEHPTPAMASITGSVRAGKQVAQSASKVGQQKSESFTVYSLENLCMLCAHSNVIFPSLFVWFATTPKITGQD